MENLDKNIFDDSSQFGINNPSKELLKTIVFWSKFISITGLLAVITFSLLFLLMVIQNEFILEDAIVLWAMLSVFIIPLLYLFIFARKTEKSLAELDTIVLQKAIQNLKSYFKSIGISMILIFILFVIAMASVIISEMNNF
ncbi:hypothetical protein ACE193_01450 [Bernardetia sp. OM2101]|uniref:hypothetical protein n=1 Tax=Bernardetia sp. OM2101 TaxID=3344876 RepID=UPI0035CE8FFB